MQNVIGDGRRRWKLGLACIAGIAAGLSACGEGARVAETAVTPTRIHSGMTISSADGADASASNTRYSVINLFSGFAMKHLFGTSAIRRAALIGVTFLLGSAAGCGGVEKGTDAQPAPVLAAMLGVGSANGVPTRYTVTQLASGGLSELDINARGQVAFGASFFDGQTVKPIASHGPGGVYAAALNNSGQVVGHFEPAPGENFHAFRWSEADGMLDLGELGSPIPATSGARAINAAGQAVGFAYHYPAPGPHAVIWDQARGMVDINPPANSYSMAEAINNSGVVVGASIFRPGEQPHAFRWTSAGGMVDLGTIGGTESNAKLINNAGQIAGYANVPGSPNDMHGVVWTTDSVMVDIGTLGGTRSNIYAMNDAGRVAGWSINSCGNMHAISWTREGGLVDLDPSCGAHSVAFGINNKGDIVGIWSVSNEVAGYRAVVWTADEGRVDLNTRLLNAPPGLILTQGMAINDEGEIVAYSNAGLVLLKPGSQEH